MAKNDKQPIVRAITAQPNSFSGPANGTYLAAVPSKIVTATKNDKNDVRIIW